MTRRLLLVLLASVGLMALSYLVIADDDDKKDQFDIRADDGAVLIPADDIVDYDWDRHVMTLKPGARADLFKRLKRTLAGGQPFMAAVGGVKVYEGMLTSVLSSKVFKSPVIVLDEAAFLPKELKADQIRINLGYPGEGVFNGADPRGNEKIEAALKADDKVAPHQK